MPKLFGKEPKVWMPWALGIGGVLLILLYLRSRSSGGGAISAPQPDNSFGAGAFAPSGAATGGTASEDQQNAFDLQLQDLFVKEREQGIANAQKMFDLQFGQAATLGNLFVQEQQEISSQLSGIRKRTKVECGKGESMYTDVNGNLACKPSGSKGVKSIGNTIGSGIQDVVGGFIGGFASAAPSAGAAYGGQVFGQLGSKKPKSTARQNPIQYGGVTLL